MAKDPSPLLGYNNNIRHKNRVFHIQTEDSGVRHPHIITHLFMDGGRILKSVKTSYAEHLGVEKMADLVRKMMKDQHKGMLIALRDGQFDPVIDGGEAPKAKAPAPTPSLQALEAAAPSRAVESGTPEAPAAPAAQEALVAEEAPVADDATVAAPPPSIPPSISPSVSRPARPPSIPDRVEITELERAVAAAPERVFEPGPSDLAPPPANLFRPRAGGNYSAVATPPPESGRGTGGSRQPPSRPPATRPASIKPPLPAGAARASGSGSARAGSPSGAPPSRSAYPSHVERSPAGRPRWKRAHEPHCTSPGGRARGHDEARRTALRLGAAGRHFRAGEAPRRKLDLRRGHHQRQIARRGHHELPRRGHGRKARSEAAKVGRSSSSARPKAGAVRRNGPQKDIPRSAGEAPGVRRLARGEGASHASRTRLPTIWARRLLCSRTCELVRQSPGRRGGGLLLLRLPDRLSMCVVPVTRSQGLRGNFFRQGSSPFSVRRALRPSRREPGGASLHSGSALLSSRDRGLRCRTSPRPRSRPAPSGYLARARVGESPRPRPPGGLPRGSPRGRSRSR